MLFFRAEWAGFSGLVPAVEYDRPGSVAPGRVPAPRVRTIGDGPRGETGTAYGSHTGRRAGDHLAAPAAERLPRTALRAEVPRRDQLPVLDARGLPLMVGFRGYGS